MKGKEDEKVDAMDMCIYKVGKKWYYIPVSPRRARSYLRQMREIEEFNESLNK